ncbi:hypothetical protein GCM10025868_33190 [Angustibacter aerolatus]|uniref:ABC transporter domain-containing protein n=1 Tax=Angustibacter aerolatus TaxID=1162965 RepID=A0ABQ6JLS4_9ACTN|nr:hypothetical protein GCM10025868_33190 [Angustibacter aerolatus]
MSVRRGTLVVVGHVDVNAIGFVLPDGRPLLDEVSFRVGDGAVVALVGPNGAGKTTLLRIIAGDLDAHGGAVTRSGGLGVMRQFVGQVRDDSTVRDLLLSVAPAPVRTAAAAVDAAEPGDDGDRRRADADAVRPVAGRLGRRRGYDAETLWDVCTVAALGIPYEKAQWRPVNTLSGGEQKRLVLEALLRGPEEVLLLDEPDNYLDVPGKRWLEQRLRETPKTVLLVSHDREPARPGRDPHRDARAGRRGQHGVGAPGAVLDVPRGPARAVRPARGACAGAGTRSTRSSRTWCRCTR